LDEELLLLKYYASKLQHACRELRLPRRALAGLLAAVPVLLPASRALALIPDDDDEDLIEKARANRKNKLASERQTEKAFSRSAKGLGAWRRRCHRRCRCHCHRGLPRAGRLPCPGAGQPRDLPLLPTSQRCSSAVQRL
jgi:hypothetical protein